MFAAPAVLFPDTKSWAISYLSSALAARPEAVASGVTVAGKVPATMPARLVTIRDDGGPRSSAVTKRVSLGVNVWAGTDQDAAGLAALVAALLEDSSGKGAVVAHLSTSGPVEAVEASGKPHRYLSVDLSVRGTAL